MYTREPSGHSYSTEIQRLRRENKRLHNVNEQLRKENNLLNRLVDSTKVGMFVKNGQNIFTYVNPAFCQHLNISKEQILFKERPRISKSLSRYINDDKKVIKSQSAVFNLVESQDAEGNHQWIETVKFPLIEDPSGSTGVYGFTYDVTDAVSAQSGLQQSK